MKVNVEVDCTPLEARQFFGLPDVQPMQTAVMDKMQQQMMAMQAQQELALAAAGEKPKAQKNGAAQSPYPQVPALGSRGGKQ